MLGAGNLATQHCSVGAREPPGSELVGRTRDRTPLPLRPPPSAVVAGCGNRSSLCPLVSNASSFLRCSVMFPCFCSLMGTMRTWEIRIFVAFVEISTPPPRRR